MLATFYWPPGQSGSSSEERHIVFHLDGKKGIPTRSISYEPEHSGSGVFLGEAFPDGSRFNRGKIPTMTREEFWTFALEKLIQAETTEKRVSSERPKQGIHEAALSGDIATIKALLKENPNLVFDIQGGATALHAAASAGNKDVAGLLLNNGADVNARNQSGMTPLSVAEISAMLFFEKKGRYDAIIDLLKQHGGRSD